jgi:hypothetical protein
MRLFSRSTTAIALAVVAALVLALWSARSGRPRTPPAPELSREALCERVACRVFAKDLVARELIAGKRSLFEAAALFGALNRLPPEARDLPDLDELSGGQRAPARSGEERLCRQVIAWVPGVLRGRPGEAKDVTDRLEAELSEELRERGVIRLPRASSVGPVEDLMARARVEYESQRGTCALGQPEGGSGRE